MRRRLFLTNIILLLVSLSLCIGISLYLSRRNVLNNAKDNVENYASLFETNIKSGKSLDENIELLESISPGVRITTLNYTKSNDRFFVTSDNAFGKDGLEEENWLELSEFSKTESFVIRTDKQSGKKMLFYTVQIPRSQNVDMYARIGLDYDELFDDNFTFILLTISIAVIVFFIASILMWQSISAGIKPINKVIGNLEELATSEQKEYNFQNIEDVSNKINDVKNELEKNMKSIKSEKNKVDMILENMGQGLIVLNEDYSFNLVNRQANYILKRMGIDYRNHSTLANVDEKVKELVMNVHNDGTHISYDIKVDDSYFNLSISLVSNIWADGEQKRIIIVITDVTDEKLADMKQKEFFSNASHELRSPLTSIIGFQELICEDFVSGDDVKDLCKKTLQESQRMKALINDMLDLSALEKEDKGEVTKISLAEMIDDITASLEPQTLIDNLTIVKNVDNSYLIANQKHIYQLIRNLIDNAIKYNRLNGKIYVNVFRKNQEVCIEVSDTGVGISESDQKQIFERFFRVDKARSRKLGSSGLGLAIVRQVCNIYAATISIESKLNEGTKITIKFPKQN